MVFYGGTGRFGEDCEFKYGIGKYLSKNWDVSIVSRVKEGKKYVGDGVEFEYIYDDKIFERKLTSREIEDAEKLLGHPIRALKHYSRSIKDICGSDNFDNQIFESTAKHIIFWDKYFRENSVDVFSTTLVSDLPVTVPLLLARKFDTRVINIVSGKFGTSNILTNGDYEIIEWNREGYVDGEYEQFYNRKREEYKIKKEIPYKDKTNEASQNLSLFSPSIFLKKIRQLNELFAFRNKNEKCFFNSMFFVKQYLNSVVRKFVSPLLFKPIKDSRYFFYPMHFPHDAQLLYKEPFIDQYILLKNISLCLPYKTKLFVKSHPHWCGSEIVYHKARQLSKIGNIQFIPYTVNPYSLIENAIATMTINSTTGFESILMNKPLITFGHEGYASKGLALVVRDLKEMPEIIFNIMQDPGYGIDVDERKKFIYKYFKNTIFTEGRYVLDYGWRYTENDYKNIADAYVKARGNYEVAGREII